ncbi:MAG: hypothetical protein GWP06_09675 [Actinobacteria bacterium]|nr:hypothetical protein [Actinomycetota bacterium]
MKSNADKEWTFFRIMQVLVLALVLLALSLYGKYFDPTITLQMCLQNPQKYDGALIEIGTETTVREILADGFTIEQMGKVVKVVGKTDNIFPNEFVSLQVVFHKGPWLELKKSHIAKYRRVKIAVSVIPVLFVFVLFFREYKFRFRKFKFVERRSCRT